MNGYLWRVRRVSPDSPELVDRTQERTLATTDPYEHMVYISETLSGSMLVRVLIHELGHCAMISFDLIEEIHRMVRPRYWIEAEEFICNFIADYGMMIFEAAYSILGENAWFFVPPEIERFVA